MTSSGGEWIAVPIPGEADRWDWVPGEQPPSPDGGPGKWHVVGGSGEGAGKWAWFPAGGVTPPPAPPAAASSEQETTPVTRQATPGDTSVQPAEPELRMPWEKDPEPAAEPAAAPATAPEEKLPWIAAAEAAAAAAEVLGTRTTPASTPSPAAPQGPNPWQPADPGTQLPPPPVTQSGFGQPQPGFGQQPGFGLQPGFGQQPGYGQPAAPGGWQAAPPVDVPKQGGAKKVPLIILGVIVVLAIIGSVVAIVLNSGDDGKKNKEAITTVANEVATVEDHKQVCSSHLTSDMVNTVFGDLATCEKNDDNDRTKQPTSATVENIQVDGKSATAKVTLVGGDLDGTTGTWSFAKQENVKEGDQLWRVSEWQIDYLRSWFGKQLDNYEADGSDDPFADEDVRACVSQKFQDLDDSEFRDTAYGLLKESDDGARKMFDFMSECPSDTDGVSALRAYFEQEFRAKAQLPPSITDCAVLAMRTALTEDDLKTLVVESGQEHPDIQAKLQEVGANCAAGTPINPAPDFQEPSTGSFGT